MTFHIISPLKLGLNLELIEGHLIGFFLFHRDKNSMSYNRDHPGFDEIWYGFQN